MGDESLIEVAQYRPPLQPARLHHRQQPPHERAIVAILQFSDLYGTHAPNTLEAFDEKELAGRLPGTRLRRRARR